MRRFVDRKRYNLCKQMTELYTHKPFINFDCFRKSIHSLKLSRTFHFTSSKHSTSEYHIILSFEFVDIACSYDRWISVYYCGFSGLKWTQSTQTVCIPDAIAPRVDIGHNIAETEATQINNVNISTWDPLDSQDTVPELGTDTRLMMYRL